MRHLSPIVFVGFLSLPVLGAPLSFEGYVGLPGVKFKPESDEILLRNAQNDYVVKFSSLPQNVRENLLKEDGSTNKMSLTIPDGAVVSTKEHPGGVRPDCSEIPFNYQDLTKLASDPKIKNQQDFLNAIPEGTLQTFTFTFKSESAQGPGVSEEFPGIIRMSEDGKLMIRYTCDPSKPTYNRVEMMTWDDATDKFKMVSMDFGRRTPTGPHVEENPALCLKCHNPGGENAPVDPRPNWQQYDQWDGFYGGQDDTFNAYTGGETIPGHRAVTEEEATKQKADYLKFREKQKDNPCYSTLPWPKGEVENADIYPYASQGRQTDYVRRPNLKITDVQSHLSAKRLARKFKERPEYNLIKYALAMSTLGCEQYQPSQIRAVLPETTSNASAGSASSGFPNPANDPNELSLHYQVGRAMGMRPQDWTMHFGKDDNAFYNGSIPPDYGHSDINRDYNIADLMQSEIAKSTVEAIPGMSNYMRTTRGVQKVFGNEFACIDDLGGVAYAGPNDPEGRNSNAETKVCEELASAQKNLEENILPPLIARRNLEEMRAQRENACRVRDNALDENVTDVMKVALAASQEGQAADPERGKQLVTSICMQCHVRMGGYSFFANEDAIKAKFVRTPNFLDRVKTRMGAERNPMPPTGALSPLEQADVQKYLETFRPK